MLDFLELLLWPFDYISRWRIALCVTLAMGASILLAILLPNDTLQTVIIALAFIVALAIGGAWDRRARRTR